MVEEEENNERVVKLPDSVQQTFRDVREVTERKEALQKELQAAFRRRVAARSKAAASGEKETLLRQLEADKLERAAKGPGLREVKESTAPWVTVIFNPARHWVLWFCLRISSLCHLFHAPLRVKRKAKQGREREKHGDTNTRLVFANERLVTPRAGNLSSSFEDVPADILKEGE